MRRNFSQVGRALVRRSRGEALSVLKSLTLVAVTTIALLILDQFFALRHVTLVYLVPVVIAATKLGIGPAVIAAVAGGGASAFFFYPPIYSFLVEDPQHLIELPLFVFVAIVTGHLASSLRRQADLARRRETEVHDLYAFSRRLAAAHTPGDIYTAIREHLASVIGRRTILFEAAPPGVPGAALSDEGQIPDAVKRAMEALAEAGKGSGNSSVVEEGGRVWLVRPVCGNAGDFGVLAIDLGQQKGKMADAVRERVDAVLADATATLEHLDLGRALSDARVRSETEALRDALIGSVSHQLRTPLVSILGAATVISSAPGNRGDPRRRSPISCAMRSIGVSGSWQAIAFAWISRTRCHSSTSIPFCWNRPSDRSSTTRRSIRHRVRRSRSAQRPRATRWCCRSGMRASTLWERSRRACGSGSSAASEAH
jgi:two-component system, OmpR family, sensor histidine kinase KdpD